MEIRDWVIICCTILIAYPLFSVVSTLSQIRDHLEKIRAYLYELSNKPFHANSMDVHADIPEVESSLNKLLWVMNFDEDKYERENAEKAQILVNRAIKDGNKMKAIVDYRRTMNVTLEEARDFVESQESKIE